MPRARLALAALAPSAMVALTMAALAVVVVAAAQAAAPAPALAPARATLRYLGHSCFQITTAGGELLVIDPYAGGEWPGLALPYLHADWVLVTHEHWDHNAWRDVRGKPKRIQGAGRVTGKGFTVTGFAGRHAPTGGESVQFQNTVFLIELAGAAGKAGVRLCHLGDNGPMTEELRSQLGPVDVLMLPVDGENRVLTYDQAREWIDALSPRVVIPMHYRLPGLSLEQIQGIGTIDDWLARQAGSSRLPSDTLPLDVATLSAPGARQVLALTVAGQRLPDPNAPAPGSAEAASARREGELAAAKGDLATALQQFEKAAALDPGDAVVLEKIGFLQLGARRPDRALEFFEKSVEVAGAKDPRGGSLAWLGAGMALDLLGRRQEAIAAYKKVIELGVNEDHQVDEARGHLESPYTED